MQLMVSERIPGQGSEKGYHTYVAWLSRYREIISGLCGAIWHSCPDLQESCYI